MGRGRAKAKQTKVARDLKYRTQDPDLSQLQRELSGDSRESDSEINGVDPGVDDSDADDDDGDDYDEYVHEDRSRGASR